MALNKKEIISLIFILIIFTFISAEVTNENSDLINIYKYYIDLSSENFFNYSDCCFGREYELILPIILYAMHSLFGDIKFNFFVFNIEIIFNLTFLYLFNKFLNIYSPKNNNIFYLNILFISLLPYGMIGQLIRQSFATIFILIAIISSFKKSIIFAILSIFTHYFSILLIAPTYLVKYLKNKKLAIYLTSIYFFMSIYILGQYTGEGNRLVGDNQIYSLTYRDLIFIILFIILLIKNSIESNHDVNINILTIFLVIYIIFGLISYRYGYFGLFYRVGLIFNIFIMPLIFYIILSGIIIKFTYIKFYFIKPLSIFILLFYLINGIIKL